ncbi:hypothetical protein KFE25_012695 [Diacronema lutheri]|uniref:C3H1-type domain-containing protein n=2 Tax=Diacronema lutheri TaxID=2081491 RepID=A0A8J5X6T4_DIALT|nr:hypothetical protein KFE25_012695 [Diacronema lutheri]
MAAGADASVRLAGVPLVVPLGFHCAPSIVNDVLGHDEGRPRMRTPFSLGVFPPAEIARLLDDGLSASGLVGRDVLMGEDGEPLRFADDPTYRKFAHGVLVRHRRYAFTYNHDFARADGGGDAIVNQPWVHGMYEAKVSQLRAMLRSPPAGGIVLCTVASPLSLGGRVAVAVPTGSELARDVAAALRAVRALAAAEGAAPDAVVGAVVLYAPPDRAPAGAAQSNAHGGGGDGGDVDDDGRPRDVERLGLADVCLEPLPSRVLAELQGYGQLPVPRRGPLYRAVYSAFVDAAARLRGGALRDAFPPWERTRYAVDVLAPRLQAALARRKPCVFFRQDRCHFGDACRFAHILAHPAAAGSAAARMAAPPAAVSHRSGGNPETETEIKL